MKLMASALTLTAILASAVSSTVPTFVDVSAGSGLDHVVSSGGLPKRYVLEVNGSGVCWIDYDADGLMDLYVVNGSTLRRLQGQTGAPASTNHLYRNLGKGRFRDVTQQAGVPGSGWGFGCVANDYNNDGHMDLLVTNFGPNILYKNGGSGKFSDVTSVAGVGGGDVWHAGAAFSDYDRDGDLDLFVPGYLSFDIHHPEQKTCEYKGLKVHACGPLGYKGAPDTLFRNNGDGTFTDVTTAAGIADNKLYFGFQAVWEDFDNDGWPDLFVGNDSNPNYLYRNKKDGSFEEVGVAAGVAYSGDGKELSSMGVTVGDYDHDGWMDIFVTTFADDNYVLFHNDGEGIFSDVSFAAGVAEPTVPYLGWGTGFFDADNDTYLDLYCVNGHVFPEVDTGSRETYRQPLQFLRNMGAGRFAEQSSHAGLSRLGRFPARGSAYADFDNDGDLDSIVSLMDEKPLLLRNEGGNRGNWIQIRLQGTVSNRMGVGARVRVTAMNTTQTATLRAGEGYLSSNDPRLHFGLGTATEAVVEVSWPSGRTSKKTLPAGKMHTVVE
jgi:enediyne biosynthesis protein E4